MSRGNTISVSRDYEMAIFTKEKAYLVSISDWEYLKKKISCIDDKANPYHTVGSILLGISGSALISAITYNIIDNNESSIRLIICLAICLITLISGILSLCFARSQRKNIKSKAIDVLEQMGNIENRFNVG